VNHYKIQWSKEHLPKGEGCRGKEGLELKGVEGRRLVS